MYNCKISRPFYVAGSCDYYLFFIQITNEICIFYFQDGKIEFRSLVGQEKKRLFENFEISSLFPTMEDAGTIEKVFLSFSAIYKSISTNSYFGPELVSAIKKQTFEWLELYKSVFHNSSVIPYMHVFTQHLHEMVQIHGNVNLFTMQGNVHLSFI
jgi:hypothetical protein